MRKSKKSIPVVLALLLFLSFPLSSIVVAQTLSDNSGQGQVAVEPACQQYSKNANTIGQQPSIPYIKVNGDGTATAKFQTLSNCVEVSLSVYTYANDPKPYEDQVHYKGTSKRYNSAGPYELTVGLPRCGKAQIDLYAGPIQETLKPDYGHDHLTLRSFLLYVGSDCTPPSQTPSESPDVTPSESPDVTPSESPDVTPSESPDVTPSESPDVTPSESPDVTPSESPDVTPSESPDVTPSESPDVTPSPTPSSTPAPTPSTGPSPSPQNTPTINPSATPVPTPSDAPSEPPSEPPVSPEPTDPPDLVVIEEDPVPVGGGTDTSIDHSSDEVVPDEEEVPLAVLPKTADTAPWPYYLFGSVFALTGALLLRKRERRQET